MNHWQGYPVPATRIEAPSADRMVRAFAQRPQSVHAMVARAVRECGAHEALVCEGQRWTYSELDEQASRIAGGLAARGVGPGDRIALFMGNRAEFVFVFFAVQRLGAVAVPIGVREVRAGLTFLLNQCTAKAIVFDADLAPRIPDAQEVPTLTLRIVVGSAPGAEALADVASSVHRAAPVAAREPANEPTNEHATAVILYTSGTTGHPKGAMLTHFNLAHSVLHYAACMQLRAGDRSALAVPASHVTGLVAIILAMTHVGGTVIIVPAFKAADFVALMARERITHTLMVPAMYTLCLMTPGFAQAALMNWRIGGFGGAPMPVATIDALGATVPNLVLINAYGATETTSPVTMMPAGLTREHADSVGVALPCAQIVVMDEQGVEVPAGETGELWIAGPMVIPGYWDNPDATVGSFTAGYWHSGDLGAVDAQGFVRIFDRKKDMLNRGGFKVYSVEVESALMAMRGVIESAVVGRPCPVLGERVHAFLYAPDVAHDDDAVRRHCAECLADYKVPETLTWCDAPLPRNANGKVMKRVLRDTLIDGIAISKRA